MKLNIKFTDDYAAKIYDLKNGYGSEGAAGFDLRACITETMTILTGEQVMIPTGIAIQLETELRVSSYSRTAAIALPRSGRGAKDGLVLGNTIGLIDEDYQGQIMLCVWARPTSGHVNQATGRMNSTPVHIEPGERIAQLVLLPVIRPEVVLCTEFRTETARGIGGFGSTGKA